MKPQQPNNNTNPTRGITANDLVVGGKYVYKDKLHTYYGFCKPNDFVFYDTNHYYIFLKDLNHITPYHEPNECCHLECDDCPYTESTMMELKSLHNQTKQQ